MVQAINPFLKKKCLPCEIGGQPMPVEQAAANLKFLNPAWKLSEDGKKLERHYKFSDFASALKFVNEVGRIAEVEGHHPDIYFTWGKVDLEIYTHAVGGLSENDFILASKIDALIAG